MRINKEYIFFFINNHKEFLIQNYHVAEMKLFGSFAKDSATDNSDIDILYTLEKNYTLSFREYTAFLYFIEDNLHRKADFVNSNNMNPLILKEAEKSLLVLL
jgi:uncharacterized protein